MIEPMLCTGYLNDKGVPRAKVWPAIVEPKKNGCRFCHDGSETWTKRMKQHKLHIHNLLEGLPLPCGRPIDGEVMLPAGDFTFQETISAVKKSSPLDSKIEFWVFDIMDFKLDTQTRIQELERWYQRLDVDHWRHIRMIPWWYADTPKTFREWHDQFKSDGDEGAIYREPGSLYVSGHNKLAVLKDKDRKDAEFKIIGFKEGTGKFVGVPIWRCVNEYGEEFNCTPAGKMPHRRSLWTHRKQKVGKMLTVAFFEFTDRGVPQHPVGLEIRDYE